MFQRQKRCLFLFSFLSSGKGRSLDSPTGMIAVAPGVGILRGCCSCGGIQERDVKTPKTFASPPVLQLQRCRSRSQCSTPNNFQERTAEFTLKNVFCIYLMLTLKSFSELLICLMRNLQPHYIVSNCAAVQLNKKSSAVAAWHRKSIFFFLGMFSCTLCT